MLKESDKAGHRPRIKGRFGTHAEQLRNWLGEYLLAKYDQTCQLNTQRDPHGSVLSHFFCLSPARGSTWQVYITAAHTESSSASVCLPACGSTWHIYITNLGFT